MKSSGRERIAFLGGGNMAEALIRGLRASGVPGSSLEVSEPVSPRRRTLAKRYGVRVHDSNAAVVDGASIIILAVKPQTMAEALDDVKQSIGGRQLVVSIAAGISTGSIEKRLASAVRVVRVMPNTPCLLGEGMSVLVAGRFSTKSDLAKARAVFATVGATEIAEDEAWLDAVTGLSGSGPAYVYRFAEALIEGGTRAGLPASVAERLAFQTLIGAAKMLREAGKSPGELREAVSSPGGTTLAGLARMKKGRFFETVRDGVIAATARSRELAKLARREK